jgi:signal transduction histidine kinase
MALDSPPDASEETPAERRAVDIKLHDETIQALYGVSLRLQAAAGLATESPDALAAELESAVRAIDTVIDGLRGRIDDLTGQEYNDMNNAPGLARR